MVNHNIVLFFVELFLHEHRFELHVDGLHQSASSLKIVHFLHYLSLDYQAPQQKFDHYEFLNLKNEVMAKFKSTSLWFERKFDEIEQESRSKSKAGSEKDKLE